MQRCFVSVVPEKTDSDGSWANSHRRCNTESFRSGRIARGDESNVVRAFNPQQLHCVQVEVCVFGPGSCASTSPLVMHAALDYRPEGMPLVRLVSCPIRCNTDTTSVTRRTCDGFAAYAYRANVAVGQEAKVLCRSATGSGPRIVIKLSRLRSDSPTYWLEPAAAFSWPWQRAKFSRFPSALGRKSHLANHQTSHRCWA